MRLLITGGAGFIGSTYPHPAYRKFADWKEFSNANQVLKSIFSGVSPKIADQMLNHIHQSVEGFNKSGMCII